MLFESEISAAPPAGSTAIKKKNKYAQQSNFWIWSKINDHLIFLNVIWVRNFCSASGWKY